jgi:putative transposase
MPEKKAVKKGADFCHYADDVPELKTFYRIQVNNYCLMTNHVHLLLVSGEAIMGLGQMMKALVARATRYLIKLLVS